MRLIHFKILKKMILKIFQVLRFLNYTVVVNQHKNFRTFLVNTRNALPKLYVVIIGKSIFLDGVYASDTYIPQIFCLPQIIILLSIMQTMLAGLQNIMIIY